jgi:hypothetical protein
MISVGSICVRINMHNLALLALPSTRHSIPQPPRAGCHARSLRPLRFPTNASPLGHRRRANGLPRRWAHQQHATARQRPHRRRRMEGPIRRKIRRFIFRFRPLAREITVFTPRGSPRSRHDRLRQRVHAARLARVFRPRARSPESRGAGSTARECPRDVHVLGSRLVLRTFHAQRG